MSPKAKILHLLILAVLLGGCGRELPETPDASPSDATPSIAVSDSGESVLPSDSLPGDHQTDPDSDGTAMPSGSPDQFSGDASTASGNTAPSSDASVQPSGTSGPAPAAKPGKPSDSTDTVSDSPSPSANPGLALPSLSGALQVSGTQLTDSNGQPIQLKGISTHGLAWFPGYVNEDCFRQLREDWNANVVRLAMYTAENGGYCTGGDQNALKELVQNGVSYAAAQDLYVIIDWHILSDGNPNTYLDQAKDFFGEMAELYAASDNVLYEICNEPNGGVSWSEIKSYAEEVISVIREHDEDAVIIVGTPNWSQYVDQAAADPITGYDNIMYALHFYAATHKDSLRNTMTAAIDAGLPVFVTEYGICDASGSGAIDESQANQWIKTMNDYGVSYVAWNLSNKNETSALISNSCGKTSDFTVEDLSASGKWLYTMLTESPSTDSLRHETSSASDSRPAPGNNSASASDNSPAPAPGNNPASTPGSKPTSAPENPPQGQETGSPATVSASGKSLSCSASLQNSWESNGNTYYQYELTLQNTSGSDIDSWAVDISFSEAFSLSDSWNGDYSISDNNLHIVCKDYNGGIPSGGSAGNIGFIVYGSGSLQITP